MNKFKMKRHKGLAKRVKITAKGKIKRRLAGARKLMSGKPGSRCRKMRQPAIMSGKMAKNFKEALCA